METNATRMCALLVGLPDVIVVGVADEASEPLRVHVETIVELEGYDVITVADGAAAGVAVRLRVGDDALRRVVQREQVERFLDFDDGPHQARLANNMDWTQDLSTIEFLRDVGKHFSVNRLLDR